MKQRLSNAIGLLPVLFALGFGAGVVSCSGDKPTDSKKDVDTISPTVMWTLPTDGDLFVPLTWSIRASFSEPLDSSTVSASTVQLTPSLAGSVRLNNELVSFIPESLLDSGVVYTVTLRATIRDTAGNAMGSDYQWQFATYADTTRPTVVSTSPSDGATWMPVSSVISVAFSETMNPSSLSPSTFVVNPAINGTYSATDSIWTLIPSVALDSNTTFTATITTGASDRSGNSLQTAYTWSFSTPNDTIRPMVVSTFPNDGDSVTIYTDIRVTFSEAIDESTLSSSSLIITPHLVGFVAYSTPVATIHPTEQLQEYQSYTITITEDVHDLVGNPLSQPYSWTFVAVPDITPPTVSMLTPTYGECVDSSTTISMSAIDESGIDYVEFYIDFSHVAGADDSAPPYEYEWNASALADGSSHTVFAVAYDKAGNRATTDTVAVTVDHAAWHLLVEDNNEAIPRNLARLYYRNSRTQLSFRVETFNGWGDYKSATEGIDVAIFLDTDQDSTTGQTTTDNGRQRIGNIGAEYRIVVGNHGDILSHWDGSSWVSDGTVDGLVISNNSNFFEVSIGLPQILDPHYVDLIAANVILNTNQWDWAPNVNLGHVTAIVDHTCPGATPRPPVRETGTSQAASVLISPFD